MEGTLERLAVEEFYHEEKRQRLRERRGARGRKVALLIGLKGERERER